MFSKFPLNEINNCRRLDMEGGFLKLKDIKRTRPNTFMNTSSFFLKNWGVWIIASLLFGFFRFFGIPEEFTTVDVQEYIPIWMLLVMGTLAAIFYTGIELLFEAPQLKRLSFGKHLLGKALASFASVKLIMVVAYYLMKEYGGSFFQNAPSLFEVITGKQYGVVFIFFLLVSILISSLRQIDQKFGPGILWNMLSGKYHQPREEERIFMFIDLKSSTTIAEELGNLKYSHFIQDCFYDLNDIFPNYDARVYQYVGDEAVLTWRPHKGLDEQKCIQCFHAFMERLKEKDTYYIEKYGRAPEFKAGAHMGKIIITEVGIVKKELAYHGDVINTTARIQSMCNEFGQRLLISQDLLEQLPNKEALGYSLQSTVQLRGKISETAIYAVDAT